MTNMLTEFVVTSDKDGSGCEMDEHLKTADVVISQPFYPYYVTAEKMASAPNLKMAITAGIGSDHVDLDAAMANNVDVTEVTFCAFYGDGVWHMRRATRGCCTAGM